jgi:hypothetical protein
MRINSVGGGASKQFLNPRELRNEIKFHLKARRPAPSRC